MLQTHMTYEEFLDKERYKINKLMDKVLLVICLTGPSLALEKLAGLFASISYFHIAIITCITLALYLAHHFMVKRSSISKNAGILVLLSLDLLLIVMANVHIGIYITLFLVPMLSIVYYDKKIYFTSCILNYICTIIITWTTSGYFSGRDTEYCGNARSWFINRMGGYTIETLLMISLGFCLVKTIFESTRKLYDTLTENKTDLMTGIFNRKAFKDDKTALLLHSVPKELILFYVDINNLKFVNDNIGHVAGDELIIGAADCMTEVLGKYGKVYRTGGDEFISIIQTIRPANQIMSELNDRVEKWSGTSANPLHLAIGYAAKVENLDDSFEDLEDKAEQMMYLSKERFYTESGMDRRYKS